MCGIKANTLRECKLSFLNYDAEEDSDAYMEARAKVQVALLQYARALGYDMERHKENIPKNISGYEMFQIYVFNHFERMVKKHCHTNRNRTKAIIKKKIDEAKSIREKEQNTLNEIEESVKYYSGRIKKIEEFINKSKSFIQDLSEAEVEGRESVLDTLNESLKRSRELLDDYYHQQPILLNWIKDLENSILEFDRTIDDLEQELKDYEDNEQ